MPPPGILSDRVLLREWEAEQLAEYYKNVFDRRDLDIDVFKKFQQNGDIIKTTIDAKQLAKDKGFWKAEAEIHEKANVYLRYLSRLKPYDVHKIQPQTYDLKMIGDPSGGRKKKSSVEVKNKKKNAMANIAKKKAAAKIGGDGGGLLDDIVEEEEGKGDDFEEEESDETPDDKYDPLAKNREGAPKLKK